MALHYGTHPTCGCPYEGPFTATAEKGWFSWWVTHVRGCAQYDPEEDARRLAAEEQAKGLHAWR